MEKIRREGSNLRNGLSKFLAGFLIPFCIWGMMSALVLHMVQVRSVFVAGGEWRLRIGVLFFALGIVLLQRIFVTLGKGSGWLYGVLLGGAITLFAAHQAWAYHYPAPPVVVFLLNEAIFGILWFTGHKITAACWRDSPVMESAAAETGILARTRMRRKQKPPPEDKKTEKKDKTSADAWAERLPRSHPGRIILYFALAAVPAFGAGLYLFPGNPASLFLMGLFLFLYLWCAFNLLYLSTLSRLAAYFEKREVSLPEKVGMPWLALGFLLATVAVSLAFFLPQPPSAATGYVRNRIAAVYEGWEAKYGLKEVTKPSPEGKKPGKLKKGRLDSEKADEILKEHYKPVDELGDEYLSEVHRDTAIEKEYSTIVRESANANEAMEKVADFIILIIYFVAGICGLVILYILVMSFGKGLINSIEGWRLRRARKKIKPVFRKKKKRKKEEIPSMEKFRKFVDPFAGSSRRTGNALVKYIWEAFLAFCADAGDPCPAWMTPYEFIESEPDAIEGFEERARFIARLFTFSEFSNDNVSPEDIDRLKEFWSELNRHARAR